MVERAIERHYRTIEMSPADCEAVRRNLREFVGARIEVARKQSEQHKRKLRDLQNEQQKLLQLFYRDGVDEEVLQAEQERIEVERKQARRWIQSATSESEDAAAALEEALSIIEGCHATYLAADPELRRLMNQAIFERLLLQRDALDAEEMPIYQAIRSGVGSTRLARTKGARKEQDPRLSGGPGSNMHRLVQLIEQLSRPSPSLASILDLPHGSVKVGVARPQSSQPVAGRLGNGVVQRAVMAVLGAAGCPMYVRDIHAAVETRLGASVSYQSVSWCLRTDARREQPRFERVSYWLYGSRD